MDDRRREGRADRRERGVNSRIVGGRRETDPPSDIDALLARVAASIEDAERIIDAAVAARKLFVSTRTVSRWIADGHVRGFQTPTHRWRLPLSELARLLDEQKKSGHAGQGGHTS